ncbi:protein LOL4-like isoform X1 [Miscanthus floridulus]|uniref:protein LOL4-like isoform X1 n=1 Tax=Miscanthus floridulus TaxID=154761 RepID=UPI00345A2506
MHSQLVCSGCKRLLQYRRGATGVCCPTCNTFTTANPSGPEMSELVCGGCFTMLVHSRSATNIRCPHCGRLNSTRSAGNQMGHLSCGQCQTTLAYPPGATTVGCPTCRNINPVRNNNAGGSTRPAPSDARPQTVLVENPKTLDEKGKLVSNVAVGVTSWKR